MVMGYHDLAAQLLRRLEPTLQTDSKRAWIHALRLIAEAEDQLSAEGGGGGVGGGGGGWLMVWRWGVGRCWLGQGVNCMRRSC